MCVLTQDVIPNQKLQRGYGGYHTWRIFPAAAVAHPQTAICEDLPVTVQWWSRVVIGDSIPLYFTKISGATVGSSILSKMMPDTTKVSDFFERMKELDMEENNSEWVDAFIDTTKWSSTFIMVRRWMTAFNEALFNVRAWSNRAEVLRAWPPADETVVLCALVIQFALAIAYLKEHSVTKGNWMIVCALSINIATIGWVHHSKRQ